jgi:hypothetical protein
VTIYADGSTEEWHNEDGDCNEEGDNRYSYYVIDKSYNGTLETELKDNTISDDNVFHTDKTIQETIDDCHAEGVFWLVMFWILWIGIIIFAIFMFYYLDNRWLD